MKLAASDSKGLTPEKALAQLIEEKGMANGRIGMDHFAIPITIYEGSEQACRTRLCCRLRCFFAMCA